MHEHMSVLVLAFYRFSSAARSGVRRFLRWGGVADTAGHRG